MEKYVEIEKSFQKLNIVLTDKQVKQFIRYYELLLDKNKVMNLTAITEFHEVVSKHFIDSVMLCKVMEVKGKLLDVGTGAGFPGIPLKIVYPHLQVVLLDSLNKRVKFLNEVIQELGLQEIEAVHGRAEDLGKQSLYREEFDICVSRAVANLSSLTEYCIPFVKLDGFFVSYKSGKVQEELERAEKAISVLGGELDEKLEMQIPDTDIFRCILKIRKVEMTPKKYPRRAGVPGKEPI